MTKKHARDSVIGRSKQGHGTEDTYSYKGWIISDSFFKRMMAFLGYNFVGTLFLYGVAIVLFLVIGAVGYIFSLFF